MTRKVVCACMHVKVQSVIFEFNTIMLDLQGEQYHGTVHHMLWLMLPPLPKQPIYSPLSFPIVAT